MRASPDYQQDLRHLLEAIRTHDGRDDGPVALSELRARLSTAMDEQRIQTVLQLMVQDGLLQPARSDGTVSLTKAGLQLLRETPHGSW